MKFLFCGRLDCPEWVLSEIAVVARISSIRVKVICAQIAKHLVEGEIDFVKIEKLTSAQGLSTSEMRAAISVLRFILSNAVRYDTPDAVLLDELQQLGLPREHCDQILREYASNKAAIAASLTAHTLSLPRPDDVQWKVDFVACASTTPPDAPTGAVGEPSIRMKIRATAPTPPNAPGAQRTCVFEMSPLQLHTLLTDLKQAKGMMEGVHAPTEAQ